jgi:hypothetical protein
VAQWRPAGVCVANIRHMSFVLVVHLNPQNALDPILHVRQIRQRSPRHCPTSHTTCSLFSCHHTTKLHHHHPATETPKSITQRNSAYRTRVRLSRYTERRALSQKGMCVPKRRSTRAAIQVIVAAERVCAVARHYSAPTT